MARTRYVPDLPDVFLGRDAVAAGVLSAEQLRGPLVRPVLHGAYRPARVPMTHVLACRAALLVVPAGVQLTGRSLATAQGVALREPGDEVDLVAPYGLRLGRRRGLRLRHASTPLPPGRPWHGGEAAGPMRCAFDLAARTPHALAVAHLDAVARAGLLDLPQFRAWLLGRHERDVRAVRRAAELADGSAESIPESITRVHLVDAGIEVTAQHRVLVRDGSVRVDLAVPSARVAVEYDGGWHALREQLERDRARLNLLTEAGWSVVHVTAAMLRRPAEIVHAVQAAIATQRSAPHR